jgi:4-hydroxy-3-polyprenylbenzoate decarboxylase
MSGEVQRLVVGITGASGSIYGIRLLEELRVLGIESHLVMSKAAELTLAYESDLSLRDLRAKADVVHAVNNVAAPIASGSFATMGMVVAPCSVRTLAEIGTGVTTSLLSRAADVVLKERRRLVLLLRETPLSLVHIRNMLSVTEMGGVVCPPVPTFYNRPQSLAEVVDATVGRALDLFDIDSSLTPRWDGSAMTTNSRSFNQEMT